MLPILADTRINERLRTAWIILADTRIEERLRTAWIALPILAETRIEERVADCIIQNCVTHTSQY